MNNLQSTCAQCKARFIMFQLSGSLTKSTAKQSVSVLDYWDGEDPEANSESVEVYNDVELTANSGAVGYAVLDEQNLEEGGSEDEPSSVYRIMTLNQVPESAGNCCECELGELFICDIPGLEITTIKPADVEDGKIEHRIRISAGGESQEYTLGEWSCDEEEFGTLDLTGQQVGGIDIGTVIYGNQSVDESLETVSIGVTGSGIAVNDDATGTGYIMYSEQNLFQRFAAAPPFVTTSQHLIAVRYDSAASQWTYSNNYVWHPFDIAAADRLLASIDFGADTRLGRTCFDGKIVGYESYLAAIRK